VSGKRTGKTTAMSQAAKPTGALGWLMAWIYRVLSVSWRSQYETIADLLGLGSDDDLLDVACGSGLFLKKHASQAGRVTGLDHSEVQLRMARKVNRRRIAAGTAEIVEGDAGALPWEDGRFSALTCDSLQCFPEPVEALKEMRRVLRAGGRAVLALNYFPSEEGARRAEQKWGFPMWNESQLRRMLEQAGFTQVRVSHDERVQFVKVDRG